jgi:hypothetical protein
VGVRVLAWLVFVFGVLGGVGLARADDAPEEITVFGHKPVTAASELTRGPEDFDLRPVLSPAQILEVVPGLVTAQHAGGGKADQILIRGFDADHGSDIALFVGGIPVNLRSHGHGQGYADLHFLIPELVERMDIAKGTYTAEVGDFATAAAINLDLRESLEQSFAQIEVGTWDTQRALLGLSPREGAFGGAAPTQTALLMIEGYRSDGPFDSPEKLTRSNVYGSYGISLTPVDRVSFWGSYYGSEWDASGQIPAYVVDSPGRDRFDDLDQKQGGDSWRWNLGLRHEHDFVSTEGKLETFLWMSTYSMRLWTNFTGYAADEIQGDGFVQRDQRIFYGGSLRYRQPFLAEYDGRYTIGADVRVDDADVKLGPQKDRFITGTTTDDAIYEYSIAPLVQMEWRPLPWTRSLLGFRAERFDFDVKNRGGTTGPQGHAADWVALPKASFVLSPFGAAGPLESGIPSLRATELFLNYGIGFHSNDARDVVEDPRGSTLPRAAGYEVGVRTRLAEQLDVAVSYWWLNMENELVFIGDEGTTEMKPRSRRRGVEAIATWSILDWLYLDASLAYSVARFENGDPVAQAPRFVAGTSLVASHEPSGLSADLSLRSLGERYALEDDDSIRLHGYTVVDFGAAWTRGPFKLTAVIANVFNTDWESSEFYYESRLAPGEPVIEDFHFTPGVPRSLNVRARYSF